MPEDAPKTNIQPEEPKTYGDLFRMDLNDFIRYLYKKIGSIEAPDMDDPESMDRAGGMLAQRTNLFTYFTQIKAHTSVEKRNLKRMEEEARSALLAAQKAADRAGKEADAAKKALQKSGNTLALAEKKDDTARIEAERNAAACRETYREKEAQLLEALETVQKASAEHARRRNAYEDMVDRDTIVEGAVKNLEFQHRTLNRVLTLYLGSQQDRYMNDSIRRKQS